MIGETISHYKILEKLGEGGMGVVYRAEDTKLKRPVALKFLSAELTSDPRAKERFVHEARAASALDHPNICTVHDIDETGDGQLFMVMTCYLGETLQETIAHGALVLERAVKITIGVARGLEKAHRKGVVHRDIKPANIYLTEDGQVSCSISAWPC
jgi:serine/threonine protein kinase